MEVESLSKMVTEGINSDTVNIDRVSTYDMLTMINEEDKKVAFAVEKVKESIAKAVDLTAERLLKGGRLIYMGAGTSGRLGVLDASECPPTFGVDFDLVKGIIAGGNSAIFKAVEGAEDSEELGKKDLINLNIKKEDVAIVISYSGLTEEVLRCATQVKQKGAPMIAITRFEDSPLSRMADYNLSVAATEFIFRSGAMSSRIAQLNIIDILYTGFLNRQYESSLTQFQRTHIDKTSHHIIQE